MKWNKKLIIIFSLGIWYFVSCVPVITQFTYEDLVEPSYDIKYYYGIDLLNQQKGDYVVLGLPQPYWASPKLVPDDSEEVKSFIEKHQKSTIAGLLRSKYQSSQREKLTKDKKEFYEKNRKPHIKHYYEKYGDVFYKNFDENNDKKYMMRGLQAGKSVDTPFFAFRDGMGQVWIEFKALYPSFEGVTVKTAEYFRYPFSAMKWEQLSRSEQLKNIGIKRHKLRNSRVLQVRIEGISEYAIKEYGSGGLGWFEKKFNIFGERDISISQLRKLQLGPVTQFKQSTIDRWQKKAAQQLEQHFEFRYELTDSPIGLKRIGVNEDDLKALRQRERELGKYHKFLQSEEFESVSGRIINSAEEVYYDLDPDSGRLLTFIKCRMTGEVPVPHCEQYFWVEELNVIVRVHYPRGYLLPYWQEVEQGTRKLILSMVEKQANFNEEL